ncbi:MAG: peptide deformylase [Bacteroidales bacterium]|nr:peptide deformylase [Bacteroidales bacterium]
MKNSIIESPKNQWVMLGALLIAGLATLLIKHKPSTEPFPGQETRIITASDSLMYVTVLPQDSTVLRTPSADLTPEELASPLLKELMAKMLYTVKHPSQDGVGIAAPQVGIDKRVVWLQRLDLEGEPWRCYLNLHIETMSDSTETLPEGCLSLPPMRGEVTRSPSVIVTYIDPDTLLPARDTIHGYTARIFQHEHDHLEGIVYADRTDSLYISQDWAAERSAFTYSRPTWW